MNKNRNRIKIKNAVARKVRTRHSFGETMPRGVCLVPFITLDGNIYDTPFAFYELQFVIV